MISEHNEAKRRGILTYLLISFGIAWTGLAIAWLLQITTQDPIFSLFLVPAAFAPAFAAFIVRKWVTNEGFAEANLKVNKQKWPYYVFAWLLPIGVVTVIIVLAIILDISQPDFTLQRYFSYLGMMPPSELFSILPQIIFIQSLIVTPFATIILFGEEFGWRGYLQSRLFADRPFVAAIATGFIWSIWHFPLILMGYQYPDAPVLGLLVFTVSAILLSIIFGWLQLKTESVWAPSLAHAATNAIGASFTAVLFGGGPNWIFVSYLGILAWIPLGAVCVWIATNSASRQLDEYTSFK